MREYLRKLWKSLFPHEKAVRYVLSAFVLAVIATWATTCRAEETHRGFETGVLYLRGPALAVAANVVLPGPGDSQIETGFVLVGLTDKDRGVMGAQATIVDGFGPFDLGIGVAYFNRETYLLGSQLNFSLLVRYNINEKWFVTARHWSNSGTTERNVGMDILTVGRRF